MREGGRRKYLLWVGLILAIGAALFASGALDRVIGTGGDARPADPAALRRAKELHLVPAQALLLQNGEISTELREKYVEYPGGIQESYFAKLVRDGEASHRDMKERIERLNRNNLAVLAHLKAYGEPLTEDLKEQTIFFRDHATRYDERWRSLPEAAAKGEELPVAQPMFPPGFPRAIAAEIQAVDRQTAR